MSISWTFMLTIRKMLQNTLGMKVSWDGIRVQAHLAFLKSAAKPYFSSDYVGGGGAPCFWPRLDMRRWGCCMNSWLSLWLDCIAGLVRFFAPFVSKVSHFSIRNPCLSYIRVWSKALGQVREGRPSFSFHVFIYKSNNPHLPTYPLQCVIN